MPVKIDLARQAIAQGAVMGTVKISSKAIPVIGAVAGGVTSFYFGSSVAKSCRSGFSPPMETWPEWLEFTDEDGDGIPDPSQAVLAMRAATEAFRSVDLDGDGIPDPPKALTVTKDAASAVGGAVGGAATSVSGAVGGAARTVGSAAGAAAGAVSGLLKRRKRTSDSASSAEGAAEDS